MSLDRILPLRAAARDYLGNPGQKLLTEILKTLPVVQLGRRRRGVRLSDLTAWIEARTTTGTEPRR